MTPAPFNVRTRVHEYGGGAFTIVDGTVYITGMDDQRLARQPGGGNVVAEAFTLPLHIARAAKIIQAGFTDGDNPGMLRMVCQLLGSRFMPPLFIRMNADRNHHLPAKPPWHRRSKKTRRLQR